MYRKKLFTTVLMILTYGCFGQPLVLSLEKGKKYELTTSTKVNTVSSFMGQDTKTSLDNLATELIEIKDIRAAEIDIASTLKNLNTTMNAMGQDMSYNSADKNSSGPLAEQLGKTIDKTKNYTVNRNGKMIKSDTPADDAVSMMIMGLTKVTGLPFINSSILGKAFKAGESWPDAITTTEAKIKTTTTGTFNVKNIENNIATILFKGVQTITGTMEQMGMEMTLNANNKIETEIIIDLTNGLITSTKTLVDMNSTTEVGGMNIPTTGKSTAIQTLKVL